MLTRLLVRLVRVLDRVDERWIADADPDDPLASSY